jgi:hypothetical protein
MDLVIEAEPAVSTCLFVWLPGKFFQRRQGKTTGYPQPQQQQQQHAVSKARLTRTGRRDYERRELLQEERRSGKVTSEQRGCGGYCTSAGTSDSYHDFTESRNVREHLNRAHNSSQDEEDPQIDVKLGFL